MMRRIAWGLPFAVALMAGGPLAAKTCHWTGAVDGFWTNANNWAEGVVPGRYETPGGRMGEAGDTAVFGDALTGKAVTTVDFDGVYSILQILTEGPRRYVYGTAESQYVPLEPYGVFSAAETAATPAAALNARLRLGVELMRTNWGGERMTVRSNATNEFVLGSWGHGTQAENHGSMGEPAVCFAGAGPLRLAASPVNGEAGGMVLELQTTAPVVLDAPTKIRRLDCPAISGVSSPQQIEITANGTLEPYSCYNYLGIARSTVVSGAGPFKFGVTVRSGALACCEATVHNTLTFRCPVENVVLGATPLPADDPARLFFNRGGGTVVFAGTSAVSGLVKVVHNASLTLSADALGLRGTYGRLGDVDFLVSSCTLRYTGAGETTDRALTLTNNANGATGRLALEQAGTGPFTVASAVALAPGMTAGTLVLKGEGAAPATFAGTLAPGVALEKAGAGLWTFDPQGDFSGAVSVKDGGTLAFASSRRLASLTVASGSPHLRVAPGATLTVDALNVAEGRTLDVVLEDDTAAAAFPTTLADAVLARVTLNGHPARLGAGGTLERAAEDANIWKSPVSGAWDDTANWADGLLPRAERTTYLDAAGGDYEVRFGGAERTTATVTNLVVGNAGAGTATFCVTNAELTVEGHTAKEAVLRLGEGAHLDVVDAVLRLRDMGNNVGGVSDRSSIAFDRAAFTARGASTFITRGIDHSLRADGLDSNLNTRFNFGTGALTFTDDAVFQTERERGNTVFYYVFKPTLSGETTEVAFTGRARANWSDTPWEFSLCGNGGRATLRYDTAWEGTENMKGLGNRNFIGQGTGLGECLIRRGHIETGTYDFLHIGTPGNDRKTTATLFATGRVEIARGASLTVYGWYPLQDSCYYGVAVGAAAALTGARGTSFVHGELRVEGTFTQKSGNFFVAEGPNADGDVFHDGGRVSLVDNLGLEKASTRGEVAIGAFGGHGRYTLTEGVFTTGHNVYLGGAFTNDLFRWHINGDVLQSYHDARGVLTVAGGSFTTAKNLVLGRDGTGVLSLTGTGVVAAASIIVSNTVGQAASEIRFTADAAGRCGTIGAGTKLVFLPGARVVVDVSAEAAKKAPRRLRVWSLDAAPEGLEHVAFDLVGAEDLRAPNGLALSDDGRTLDWNVSRGTVLILR